MAPLLVGNNWLILCESFMSTRKNGQKSLFTCATQVWEQRLVTTIPTPSKIHPFTFFNLAYIFIPLLFLLFANFFFSSTVLKPKRGCSRGLVTGCKPVLFSSVFLQRNLEGQYKKYFFWENGNFGWSNFFGGLKNKDKQVKPS